MINEISKSNEDKNNNDNNNIIMIIVKSAPEPCPPDLPARVNRSEPRTKPSTETAPASVHSFFPPVCHKTL